MKQEAGDYELLKRQYDRLLAQFNADSQELQQTQDESLNRITAGWDEIKELMVERDQVLEES